MEEIQGIIDHLNTMTQKDIDSYVQARLNRYRMSNKRIKYIVYNDEIAYSQSYSKQISDTTTKHFKSLGYDKVKIFHRYDNLDNIIGTEVWLYVYIYTGSKKYTKFLKR